MAVWPGVVGAGFDGAVFWTSAMAKSTPMPMTAAVIINRFITGLA